MTVNILHNNIVNQFCDFETFVRIAFGFYENIYKVGLLAIEFPELFANLDYITTYLKTKDVYLII